MEPESAGRHDEKFLENCMICGSELTYQTHSIDIACNYCGKTFAASVFCPNGHYVCDECHGASYYDFLEKRVTEIKSRNPMEIAEMLLQGPSLPSLGAEHHPIVVVSLLTAVKNYGEVSLSDGFKRSISDDDIREGIRRMKQIPACTCAYHGACGAGLGVGACVSILLDATCAKDIERTLSMRATNAALNAIANCGGPGCCKQSVRTAVLTGVEILKELFQIKLPISHTRCFHIKDTTHGCKGIYCQYSR